MAWLGHLKGLTRPFVVSAWTELTADNPEAALMDVETALALSEAAVSQPLLITALVRFALIEEAISPIWAGLAERRWEDAQLARLVERLDRWLRQTLCCTRSPGGVIVWRAGTGLMLIGACSGACH
jgi:hypothetical protein